MASNRHNVQTLLCLLPLLAGGLVGCESSGKGPGGVTVPLGGGTGGSNVATAPAAKPAPKAEAPKAAATPAPKAAEAPKAAAAPAPAAAPVATGSSVAYYPTGNRASSSLMVEKIAPTEIAAGQATSYQIKVTNISSSTLENVQINETIPQGFTLTNAQPAGNNGVFNLGSLGAGESKTITVNGSFAKAGSYGSCATASFTVPVCMTVNVVSPALAITKTSPASSLLCDSWPVKLVVTNSGTGTARGITVKDQLPAGLTSDGKSVVEFPAFDLAGGASREFTFNVKADKVGSYTNNATAAAQGGLNATSNNTVTAVNAPTLTIDKQCPANIRQGRPVTYNIVVTNTGNAPAANTVVRDPLPAGSTFASATEGGAVSGGAVVWNLGTLAPGQSRTVSLTINAGAGTINNEAFASATCAAEVKDGCAVSIQGVPDIGTGIEDFTGVRNVGDNHEFTYTVKNQGQINLTNVKMVATFDAGLEFVSSTFAGASAAGQTATFNIGTLAVGQTVTFKFTAKGTKAADFIVQTVTTSDQTRAARNDEQVNYVD
ncbi:MAG: hypothetical protein ACK5ZG_07550 [Phycisphaerae bacterium]|jgi:uncharacterized repeat protein (TIGR01451 family)